jgi:hypothetical protein
MINPNTMLSASCILLGLWGMLNASQWLASSAHWRAEAALGWDLQGLRFSRLYRGRWLGAAFGSRIFPAIVVLHFAASLLLCILPIGWGAFSALLILAATNLLLILRSYADGGDKMAMVVTYGLLLQMIGEIAAQPLLSLSGVLWIGGQLALCYATSGLGKLILAGWRNGAVPRDVLSSFMYGNYLTHILVKHRIIALTLAWAIILLESLFPLALFAPLPVLVAALCGMGLLHLSIAFAMGLNTYVFAFIAAYPSVLLLAQHIQSVSWPNLL